MSSAAQMSPAQLNAAARALIKQRAVRMTQVIFNQSSIVPANTPVVTINPRNVGLILGFWLKVSHSVSNGSAVQINLTDFGPANAASQIVFSDLNNNVRIQTPGWHVAFVNSIRQRRPFGAALVKSSWDTPTNYGSNWSVTSAPANIAASGTGTVTQWYWVPLAYSEDDLRGVIYANVVNATMQLQVALPGTYGVQTCVANATDSTLAMFVGAAAGSVAAVTITGTTVECYQVWLDQLPVVNNQVVLPVTDLATVYELKQTIQNQIPASQDFGYQYANFRDFFSTVAVYVNNGTTGARGSGADINYWSLQSANFTNIWKKEPALLALQTRNLLQCDLPPGVYYFDSRSKPISTTQYGNMQLILNASTATNNPYELIGVEDMALVQTLSIAGSLANS